MARRAICTMKAGSAPSAGELLLSVITHLHPHLVIHIARRYIFSTAVNVRRHFSHNSHFGRERRSEGRSNTMVSCLHEV